MSGQQRITEEEALAEKAAFERTVKAVTPSFRIEKFAWEWPVGYMDYGMASKFFIWQVEHHRAKSLEATIRKLQTELHNAYKNDALQARVKELEAQLSEKQKCESCGKILPDECFSAAYVDSPDGDALCNECAVNHLEKQLDELLKYHIDHHAWCEFWPGNAACNCGRDELIAKIEAERVL